MSETFKKLHLRHKEKQLFGRYITLEQIEPLIQNLDKKVSVSTIGTSVNGLPIYCLRLGHGKKKILMWSQMHGNESTTTKAIFDLLNSCCSTDDNAIKGFLEHCTLIIIPMLNPDGAKLYTRANFNDMDLNRDAQLLSQPESIALRSVFEEIKPDFCFNLHGQRTIFGAGSTGKSATVSFLSPAQDEALTISDNRKIAMQIILEMASALSEYIPNGIGIYDDSFNRNCVGDYFQSSGVPTILFEAGHLNNDYNREEVRRLIYMSLCTAIQSIAFDSYKSNDYSQYFSIPENTKTFYDIIFRNAAVEQGKILVTTDVAIQYEEILKDNRIYFLPKIVKISGLQNFYGHKEVQANGSRLLTTDKNEIIEGYANDFVLLKNELFSLNYQNI